ncbi:Rieske (2Fe-2S) protein [Pararhodobacter sp.]|uniref:Rieske (2Fe-2S) protein n=1 Tax=Pararhodobacter sp. TaxID=2127056 RepID=UPI002AFF842A|nr:Rieske (2Fe-2S) protein [Pararhodobacter sp.]
MVRPVRQRLCSLKDIPDGGSKGVLPNNRGRAQGFLVRQGDRVFGYTNTCPHYDRAPLEWKTDAFLNGTGDRIQCASHGALFRIEDGFCEVGPCAGQALRPLAILIEGGQIFLTE